MHSRLCHGDSRDDSVRFRRKQMYEWAQLTAYKKIQNPKVTTTEQPRDHERHQLRASYKATQPVHQFPSRFSYTPPSTKHSRNLETGVFLLYQPYQASCDHPPRGLILPTKPKPLPKYVQGARYIVDQKLRLRLSVSFQTFVYKCQRCTSFTPTTNANNSRQARYVVISVRLAFFQSRPVCRPLRHTNSLRATSRQYTMVGPELRLLNIYPELASRTPPSPSTAPEHPHSLLSVTATFASPQLGLFDLQRSLREPLPPPPAAPSPAYTHPACATSWQLEGHWPPAWPPRSPALVLAALPPPSAAPPGAHRHPTRPV